MNTNTLLSIQILKYLANTLNMDPNFDFSYSLQRYITMKNAIILGENVLGPKKYSGGKILRRFCFIRCIMSNLNHKKVVNCLLTRCAWLDFIVT